MTAAKCLFVCVYVWERERDNKPWIKRGEKIVKKRRRGKRGNESIRKKQSVEVLLSQKDEMEVGVSLQMPTYLMCWPGGI